MLGRLGSTTVTTTLKLLMERGEVVKMAGEQPYYVLASAAGGMWLSCLGCGAVHAVKVDVPEEVDGHGIERVFLSGFCRECRRDRGEIPKAWWA